MKKCEIEKLQVEVKEIFDYVHEDFMRSVGFESSDWDLEFVPSEDQEELKQYAIYLNKKFPSARDKEEFVATFDRSLRLLLDESPSQVAH